MDTDWPHDPDGEHGSEGMRKFDMAVIAKKVDEDDDFPLDRDEFVDAFGDDPIRINSETVVSLAAIFEHVEPSTFETLVDLHTAVGDAMRAGGFWEYHPAGEQPDRKPA